MLQLNKPLTGTLCTWLLELGINVVYLFLKA